MVSGSLNCSDSNKSWVQRLANLSRNSEGNNAFRCIVSQYQGDYLKTRKRDEKAALIKLVQARLDDEGYRFVVKNSNGLWVEAPYRQSRAKVAQALREQAPQVRMLKNIQKLLMESEAEDSNQEHDYSDSSSSTGSDASINPPANLKSDRRSTGNLSEAYRADNRADLDTEPLPLDDHSSSRTTDVGDIELDGDYVDLCRHLAQSSIQTEAAGKDSEAFHPPPFGQPRTPRDHW